ncbi:MAG: type II secretion system F family protein [Phycisphaerales bacterium]|nr:MAG: type II secretion system F family protein [Phycisphaerales bacterium]
MVESKWLSDSKTALKSHAEGRIRADSRRASHERDLFRRIRTRDVCSVARQLATLLRAGMPLVPGLSALVEQLRCGGTGENPLAAIMEDVARDVNSGSTLANALGKHPGIFSNLVVNMVAAGETSGTLEQVLLRVAEILENRVHLAAKVKAAVAYPLMMVVVSVAVVVFLMYVVVPSITEIFIEMERPLPMPTKLLISISGFVRTYLPFIAVAVCLAFLGLMAGYKTEAGRMFADRAKLKLPLFGNLFLKLELARLARTLGILLVSGIPILHALDTAKQVIQNRIIAGAIGSVKDMVGKGDTIANAIRKTGLFPPIVYHIITTGQMSGNLEEGLINIADMYDGEVELATKALTSLLEPLVLLFMGAVVAFIVLAVLLPITEINQVL